MIFAEASMEQAEIVKRVLDKYCKGSGHKINVDKTKMFCSKNVHFNRAKELSQHLGVGLTLDLGKYLGMPLFHKKVTNRTFAFLVHNTHARLSGWKGKYLNMAGRTILIKSVLAALPSYSMQSVLLPKKTIDEIEGLSRKFLWNDFEEKRSLHLLPWNKVNLERQDGGLNIRDLKKQNEAFIMKLCWGLLTKPTALWV